MQNERDAILQSLLYDGIRVRKLKLEISPSAGRGLVATDSLRPGETLIIIPARHLINLKSVGKEIGFQWQE